MVIVVVVDGGGCWWLLLLVATNGRCCCNVDVDDGDSDIGVESVMAMVMVTVG